MKEIINKFEQARPAINMARFLRDAGVSEKAYYNAKNGLNTPRLSTQVKLCKEMVKYGFEVNNE